MEHYSSIEFSRFLPSFLLLYCYYTCMNTTYFVDVYTRKQVIIYKKQSKVCTKAFQTLDAARDYVDEMIKQGYWCDGYVHDGLIDDDRD
jgi:hypothetical protein